MNRQHAFDAGKIVSIWATWFWGVNWSVLGAFLSCVASFLVILNMCGLLAPLRAWADRRFQAIFKRPLPLPPVRTLQDE